MASDPQQLIACTDGQPYCSAYWTTGSQVTLTAYAFGGSVFTGWGGACTGTQRTCTVTVDQARDVTATFARA